MFEDENTMNYVRTKVSNNKRFLAICAIITIFSTALTLSESVAIYVQDAVSSVF